MKISRYLSKEERTQIFIKKAIEIHGNKYDYSLSNYIDKRTKIKIKCLVCLTIFKQTPGGHLTCNGCPKCGQEQRKITKQINSKKHFIECATKLYENLYNYDNINYINDRSLIQIYCNKHKEYFSVHARNHIDKTKQQKCRKCTLEKFTENNKNIFINNCKKLYGERYDFTNINYIDLHTEIIVKCNLHNMFFKIIPTVLYKYTGCTKCKEEMHINKWKNLFILRAQKIHGNIYDYSLVKYVNADKKVEIICPIHGLFWQKPNNHIHRLGCPKCVKNITNQLKIEKYAIKFINKANKIYNNKYDYSEVIYTGLNNDIIIKCLTHGIFITTPNNHLNGGGCKQCSNEVKRCNFNLKEFINKANQIHNNEYDYSLVEYINAITPIRIICKKHGVFKQAIYIHLKGHKCKKCYSEKQTKTLDYFISKANEVHNYKYDYSLVKYIKCDIKVKIICPKHGIFEMMPFRHLAGSKCPKCAIKASRPETAWLNSIGLPNDPEHRNVNIWISKKRFNVDGIDPSNKTIFEFNGDFFHGNPAVYEPNEINDMNKCTFGQLYQETLDKEQALKAAGYTVISIWEKDYYENRRAKLKESLNNPSSIPLS